MLCMPGYRERAEVTGISQQGKGQGELLDEHRETWGLP